MAAREDRSRRVLLAGGGSGGHVFPALAVAGELESRGWRVELTGTATGMEARLVGEHGYPFHPLPARPVSGRGPVDRLRALFTLVRSTLAARRLVRRLGVAVVVGTGGYVSAPAVLGAALARVPALLVEPNAVAGLANRWLSRWAAEAAVALESGRAGLRCPATVTGVPVRADFEELPAEPPGGETVRLLVLGGSQGSAQLNREVPAALGLLAAEPAAGLPPVSVLHQAGVGKADATVSAYAAAGLGAVAGPPAAGDTEGEPAPPRADASATAAPMAVRVVPFVADTAAEIGAAHLVISRAGAITTAELCTAGRASLLVPLAGLAAGHQADNAAALAAAGASVVVPGDVLDPRRLADSLGELLGDRPRLAAMARAARTLARPGAAAAIADRVERLAGLGDGDAGDGRAATRIRGVAA